MTAGEALAQTWGVYRLLFRRSLAIAAAVYALITACELAVRGYSGAGAGVLDFANGVLSFVAPLLVEGALVRIVRNVHEGRIPEPATALLGAAARRVIRLVAASILYAVGVALGFVLVVPGLIWAARWSLMPPAIMLEDAHVLNALDRSRTIVRGSTASVLGAVVAAFAAVLGFSYILDGLVVRHFTHAEWAHDIARNAVAAVVAPYTAHLLSVVYYLLTDPDRAVVDPAIWAWPSVWRGPATGGARAPS